MKIKKLVSLCIKNKRFLLYNQKFPKGVSLQWISDGYAMYPLDGFPYLNEESLCIMFDIDGKQSEKISFHEQGVPEYICLDDEVENECILERSEVSIVMNGEMHIPYIGQSGLILIRKEYLMPLDYVEDYLELYERKMTNGKIYVAAKAGLLLKAVIAPSNIINKQFVSELSSLIIAANCALEREPIATDDDMEDTYQLSI